MNNFILASGFVLSFIAVKATPPYPQSQSQEQFRADCQEYEHIMRQCMSPYANLDEQACSDVPELLRECRMQGDPLDDER